MTNPAADTWPEIRWRHQLDENLVPVQVFSTRLEADIAREQLEAHGIPSYVSGDDAAGFDPTLQLTQGVRLIVRERDLARAQQELEDE